MKLSKVDFDLDWPDSIKVFDLRNYILTNLIKRGKVIRWSIIDIQHSKEFNDKTKLRIQAVLVDPKRQ